jgi:hypothetical protein
VLRINAACRAAGMLQARSTTDAIFGNMGVAADSVERLKVRPAELLLMKTYYVHALSQGMHRNIAAA